MTKRILLVPDSFKNSLSAEEVAEALSQGLNYYKGQLDVSLFPFADGGEGSLAIIAKYQNVEERTIYTFNPFLKPIRASYLMERNKKIAYIESAKVIGLEIINREPDCYHSSSYGLGILIKDALDQGMEEVYLFLGGSATCDAGIGMAAALGYEFKHEQNLIERPIAKDIIDIDSISTQHVIPELKTAKFHIATDVNNPLYGEKGTALIFSKQKGASEEEISNLEEAMKKVAGFIQKDMGIDIQEFEGAGAAGGLGAGGIYFLKGTLKSGFNILSDISGLENEISKVDLIITGEGHIDSQSFDGKLITSVKEMADKYHKPVWLICALRSISEKEALNYGFERIVSLYKSMPKEIDPQETRRKLYKEGKKWAATLLNIP